MAYHGKGPSENLRECSHNLNPARHETSQKMVSRHVLLSSGFVFFATEAMACTTIADNLPFLISSLQSHSASPKTLRVLVTGAGGQIAYSLLPMIVNGQMFGPNVRVRLHLLDLPQFVKNLEGVRMELEDMSPGLLNGE
jgi:hypothetical protein